MNQQCEKKKKHFAKQKNLIYATDTVHCIKIYRPMIRPVYKTPVRIYTTHIVCILACLIHTFERICSLCLYNIEDTTLI